LPFEINVHFSISNYLGNELHTEHYLLPQGTYSKTISLTEFTAGIYFAVFRAGLYYKMIPFMKK